MNPENAIEVSDLEKCFKVYFDKSSKLKDRFVTKGRNRYEERRVLRGVTILVRRGEAVGLIGRNGCGKSTTLKLLSKIIYPDKGSIEVNGRVSSLLELGAGFHPDMSGRENIYLNAAIFGLTKKEINQRIDDIISFSELGDFIENPVRTYSSGMYMRLAFSVAINVNAEILLIDEILGVGDVSFQKKCFERLQEIKSTGVTIVIVSHSLEQIEKICDRCIWLENGIIQEEGLPNIINAHYYKKMEDERLQRCESSYLEEKEKRIQTQASQTEQQQKHPATNISAQLVLPPFCDKNAVRTGPRIVEFQDISIIGQQGNESIVIHANESFKISFCLLSHKKSEKVSISLSIWRDDGILCYGVNTYHENGWVIDVDEQPEVSLLFSDTKLMSGRYYLNVGLYNSDLKEYDSIKRVKYFYIQSDLDGKEFGLYQMAHKWSNDLKEKLI